MVRCADLLVSQLLKYGLLLKFNTSALNEDGGCICDGVCWLRKKGGIGKEGWSLLTSDPKTLEITVVAMGR